MLIIYFMKYVINLKKLFLINYLICSENNFFLLKKLKMNDCSFYCFSIFIFVPFFRLSVSFLLQCDAFPLLGPRPSY